MTRRDVLRAGAVGGAALSLGPVGAAAARTKRARPSPSPARTIYDFNQGWRFGGAFVTGSQEPGYPDAGFGRIAVPHTVVPLSWGGWSPVSWQTQWIYRKGFSGARLSGGRVFLDFDGVMTDATVYLNGVEIGQHQGGFLPWSVELTGQLLPAKNVLGVVVDGRWLSVPPGGSPGGPADVDYLMPPGIYRDARLRLVPNVFIADVFAKPTDVLSGRPRLEVAATIDALATPRGRVQLTVEVLSGSRVVAKHSEAISVRAGTNSATLTLTGIPELILWSPSHPKLYTVRTTLSGTSISSDTLQVDTGFRHASFEVDGFYLNGQRLQIRGLNHHQLFPYIGMAAPQRLQVRDAELIKNELNCNMVRCSHYPQSPHFLDACDRLGLMVWEEAPGWQYVGDPPFQELVLENVRDMVVRDRNRPSVIVWGTRLNEAASYYDQLYAECRTIAYEFDGTRQTTGAMVTQSTAGWSEDVFSYNDYHTFNGNAILKPPLTGVPYMVSEAVGALDGPPTYRWIDSSRSLQTQARMHAQVHNIARSDPAYAGLLGWCSVDYASLSGGDRNWETIKWPGVLDTFRVPKLGASFYRSQVSPAVSPVILPAFYWDFGPNSPSGGPGQNAMIATNCEVLEIYLNGRLVTTARPDTGNYGSLEYPPVFVDLTVDGAGLPTLEVVGYVGGKQVTSLQMSSNPAGDHLRLDLEDSSITADGVDTTRFSFRALDLYGNQRPYVAGPVTLSLKGPGVLIAQNPFDFALYGGVGGGFIRSRAGHAGVVTVAASHPALGQASAKLKVTSPTGRYL